MARADGLAVLPDGDGVGRGRPGRRPPPRGRDGPARSVAWADGASRRPLVDCVRARPPRPAHLGHRSLQLPLHLLHAGGGPARGCPARSCSPSRRSSASPGCSSSATASARSASPAASPPCGPTCPCSCAKLAALPVDLALTTNGATLRSVAAELAAAGLRRVNVSLDTLQPERFAELTRRDELGDVLAGIDAALAAGLAPGEGQRRGARRRERRRDRRPRPLRPRPRRHGAVHRVHAARRRRRLAAATRSCPRPRSSPASTRCSRSSRSRRGSEPAERFRYLDGLGEVGVIPSVTEPFCEQCDRIRLTADGQLRSCLFSLEDHDLRGVLRSGGADDDLSAADRGLRRRQVGRPRHQPGPVRPPPALACARSAAEPARRQ